MRLYWLPLLLLGCQASENMLIDPLPHYGKGYAAPLEDWEEEERFEQSTPKPLDILFAIDKSCSMQNLLDHGNEASINEFAPNFFDALEAYNIDFHVGVTATTDSGQLVQGGPYPFLTRATGAPAAYFSLMNVGAHALGEDEAGSDAFFTVMRNPANEKFFRPGVPLQLIVISDEDDQSEITLRDMVTFLDSWERSHQAEINYTAAIRLNDSYCPNSSLQPSIYGDPIGYRYMYLAEQLDGQLVDICSTWEEIIVNLADYSIPLPTYEYQLKFQPIQETIEVFVDHSGIIIDLNDPDDWIYNEARNTVTLLTYEPDENEAVIINYERDGVK